MEEFGQMASPNAKRAKPLSRDGLNATISNTAKPTNEIVSHIELFISALEIPTYFQEGAVRCRYEVAEALGDRCDISGRLHSKRDDGNTERHTEEKTEEPKTQWQATSKSDDVDRRRPRASATAVNARAAS